MNTSTMLWSGRILTALFAMFMLGASVAPKLLGLPVAEETMAELGWPPGYAFMIGVIELACVVLYLIPQTSVLGAVLMMGVLGGAMATQIRVDNPLFSHILFSIYLGLFMWAACGSGALASALYSRSPARESDGAHQGRPGKGPGVQGCSEFLQLAREES